VRRLAAAFFWAKLASPAFLHVSEVQRALLTQQASAPESAQKKSAANAADRETLHITQ